MWHWIRDRQRKKILESPFPDSWKEILDRNVSHYGRLDEKSRKHLRDLIHVFIAEKHWVGCGGLELSDEIRVTIAALACIMVLELPHDLYSDVESILIYPSTVFTPEHQVGVFETPQISRTAHIPILGQAHQHGPVILVWDAVLQGAKHPETGHNVVYHEFAHKIDLMDGGQADGTPPLESRQEVQRWVDVCSREFLKLRELAAKGKRTFLDSYGAVSEAEFFAMVTEQFFDQPVELKKHHFELYEVLRSFYRQDPASDFKLKSR